MSRHEGLAFVLDIMEYRESSSLVSLLTENEGRITVIGRGLRKPNSSGSSGRAALQPFNLVYIQYQIKDGQTLGNLNSADLEKAWSSLRSHLESYALASYWFEILKETSQPRDTESAVFEMTNSFLNYQEMKPGLDAEVIKLLSDLCGSLGFGLHWDVCSICGKATADPEHFSIKTGIMCHNCVQAGKAGIPLKNTERAFLKQLLQSCDTPSMAASTVTQMDLLSLINRFLVYHLERPLKTFGFLQNTLM